MKRYQATILFILILLLAKLSEPGKETEPRPDQELLWIEGERIIAGEGFMDLPKDERENLLKNIKNKP